MRVIIYFVVRVAKQAPVYVLFTLGTFDDAGHLGLSLIPEVLGSVGVR